MARIEYIEDINDSSRPLGESGYVNLRHAPDADKAYALMDAMREHGYNGEPVIIYKANRYDGDEAYINITGCHRITAAGSIEIGIPAWVIWPETEEELDDLDFAASDDDFGMAETLRQFGGEVARIAQAEADKHDDISQ